MVALHTYERCYEAILNAKISANHLMSAQPSVNTNSCSNHRFTYISLTRVSIFHFQFSV